MEPPELGRHKRKRTRTRKWLDAFPEAEVRPQAAPESPPILDNDLAASLDAIPEPPLPQIMKTLPNTFHIYREYLQKPTAPLPTLSRSDLYVGKTKVSERQLSAVSDPQAPEDSPNLLFPFPNVSVLDFYYQYVNANGFSRSVLQGFSDLVSSDGYQPRLLANHSWEAFEMELDRVLESSETDPRFRGTGWRTVNVPIEVPFPKHQPVVFQIPGLRYRPIMTVLTSAVQKVRFLCSFRFALRLML